MTRRLLPYNEWDKLVVPVKRLFGEDKEPPPPEIAPYCAVEEDDNGQIVGFLFLQLIPHLEPFGSLGGASLSGLREVIDSALTNTPNMVYYCCTENPSGDSIALSKGWEYKGSLFFSSPQVLPEET